MVRVVHVVVDTMHAFEYRLQPSTKFSGRRARCCSTKSLGNDGNSLTANESACAMPVARSTACCVDAFTSENAGAFHSAGDLISASVKSVTFSRDMLERKWPIEPYNAFLSRRSICDWFTGDARSRRRSDWYAASLVADMLEKQTCSHTSGNHTASLVTARQRRQVSPLRRPLCVEESRRSSRA